MAPSRPIDELLTEALRRPAGSEREAWIDAACGRGSPLAKELSALIEAHRDAGHFLCKPLVGPWLQHGAKPGDPGADEDTDA